MGFPTDVSSATFYSLDGVLMVCQYRIGSARVSFFTS